MPSKDKAQIAAAGKGGGKWGMAYQNMETQGRKESKDGAGKGGGNGWNVGRKGGEEAGEEEAEGGVERSKQNGGAGGKIDKKSHDYMKRNRRASWLLLRRGVVGIEE